MDDAKGHVPEWALWLKPKPTNTNNAFMGHGSNGNEWGHYIYIPAVTAVFNYTGFGLQVTMKLVPQITGWTSKTSTSTSTRTFTTTSQSVQQITQYIRQTVTGIQPTVNAQFISYNGGGSGTNTRPNPGTVKYPVYNTALSLTTSATKALLFTGATILDADGDLMSIVGNALTSAGNWLKGTGNPIGQAIGSALAWAGSGLSWLGNTLATDAKLIGNYAQAYGTTANWQSVQVQPGQGVNIGSTYSITYNGAGNPLFSGPFNVYPAPSPVNLGGW